MKAFKFTIPTRQSLENAALRYLARYAASEASLRRVLKNRLARAALRIPEFADDASTRAALHADIERIVDGYKKSGVLNDKSYAETKVGSLRRQGRSRRAIAQKLGRAGIDRKIIESALTRGAAEASCEEAELAAATILAKRRKMGPFRHGPADEKRRLKEYATFARAGFSANIARKVLKADPPEAWE